MLYFPLYKKMGEVSPSFLCSYLNQSYGIDWGSVRTILFTNKNTAMPNHAQARYEMRQERKRLKKLKPAKPKQWAGKSKRKLRGGPK